MTFLELPDLDVWIAGHREPAALSIDAFLHDPNTGLPLQAQRQASSDQVDRAIAAAHAATESWTRRTLPERARVLGRFADGLDQNIEQLAQWDATNSGVPISQTRLFAGSLGDTVRRAVELAQEVGEEHLIPADGRQVYLRRVPWGATALILPWNAPAAVAVKKMAYALVAGAPIVLKPSPASPWSAQLVMKCAVEAGITPSAVNLVLGGADVGAQLSADPRIRAIALTGSTPTGRAVAAAAAPRFARLQMELGSSNPAVLLPDVEIVSAAIDLAAGMSKLNGQWCEAPRRVYVPTALVEDLVDALRSELSALVVGSSVDPATTLGPQAFEGRLRSLQEQRDLLEEQGSRIVAVGEIPYNGWFFAPTLAIGRAEAGEECFGPLLSIHPVPTEEEAVARANAGAVGLAAYVFTADISHGIHVGRNLVAGEVKVNGTSLLDMAADSAQSFFGSSGIGGHGDRDVLEFFRGKQVVGRDLVNAPL